MFTHDCNECTFLGSISAEETTHGTPLDVYVHADECDPTIILRYSNDGPDYYSFPLSVARHVAGHFEKANKWGIAIKLYAEYQEAVA